MKVLVICLSVHLSVYFGFQNLAYHADKFTPKTMLVAIDGPNLWDHSKLEDFKEYI